MKYTAEELSFILYNNRSINGVVKNFIKADWNWTMISDIEMKMEYYNSIFNQRYVEIQKKEILETEEDIIIYPNAIQNLKDKILLAHKNLCGIEKEYLINRGINDNIISKWKLGGLSTITNYSDLKILNATVHPILKNLIEDGIEGGGIIIPLFESGRLINCAIRKISDVGKLKYSLACPDIDIWGIEDVKGKDIWITEGLFDMMAMNSIGLKSVSVSSAMWSGIQLYKLIESNPNSINIFCDNDNVGLRTGYILSKILNVYGIETKTFISECCKDASEMIFEKKMGLIINEVEIDEKLINKYPDNFDIVNYIKNRNF
jgi:hypothetical protein